MTPSKLVSLVLIMLLTACSIPQTQDSDVHYHAGFIVSRADQIIDFSGFENMHIKPCDTDDHQQLTPEEEQIEKAHLHDSVGNVVHVHRPQVTWGDLFTNLSYQFSASVSAYTADGIPLPNPLTAPIQPDSSIVFIDGPLSIPLADILKSATTIDQIKSAETASENCGT